MGSPLACKVLSGVELFASEGSWLVAQTRFNSVHFRLRIVPALGFRV